VVEGIVAFKMTAAETSVGVINTLQRAAANPGVMETFDIGARALGGIIQSAPEVVASADGFIKAGLCNVICQITPAGDARDKCIEFNCPDDTDYYGDYDPDSV
jgi:hypothetical protein